MRSDGRRVKSKDPMYYLVPHFLPHRYDAMNMITLDIPTEPLREYMNAKRREGIQISHIALVVAAYLRMVAEFPQINRFIGNKKIYAHKDFTVSMVVMRPGEDTSTMSKVYLDYTDDIFEVQRKMLHYITENRDAENENGLDKVMGVLVKLPGLLNVVGAILRFMDRHGLLPKALIKVSPFHASLLISNLASIRTNHIYHHVYEFGTTSVAMTMGNMREVPRRKHGEVVLDRCIPLGVVMDERICSGHYFAQGFARMKAYLANPELLEGPPTFEIIPDE